MSARELVETGVEWLRWLPEDWSVIPIGRECWVRARLGWKGLKADEYVDSGGYPMLSTPDIKGRDIDFRSASRITKVRFDESPEIKLRVGDVLLTKDGSTIGTANIVRDLPEPATLNGSIALLTPSKNLDGRYLYYVIVSQYAQKVFGRLRGGAGVPHLFQRDINRIRIPRPPLEEQRIIADYLDHETSQIDALVAKQEEFIGLLNERSRAIRREALTPGEGWKTTRIKHLAKTNLGKMLDAGRTRRAGDFSAPYVRAADILASGTVRLTDLNEMPFSPREMHQYDLRRNDILIIEGGATVGRPGLLQENAPGIAFQKTVNRLRPGPDLDARFAYWSLLELYEADYYPNFFGGVSFVHLTGEKLREISLAHPSVEEQHLIGQHIDTQITRIDALIAKAEELIVFAQERRSALITAAVTGQFDVRPAALKAG